MDFSLVEPAVRHVVAFEFALMAIVGAFAAVNCLILDLELRRLLTVHHEIIEGIREAVIQRMENKEAARQERLESIKETLDA